MRRFLLATIIWAMTSLLALAETPILSAPEAQQRIAEGELILLDIRSRQEWQETGIAKGAWPVSMHERDFGERLQAILAVYPPEQIAMICAVGGRTGHVTSILEKNGIRGVADLSEGMEGNARGPGWIARGLEVVPVEDALAAYQAEAANW